MDKINRYLGSLMGLAVGDALGVPLEFKPYGTFEPLIDLVGGGRHNLPAGYWTDDTSMALCLADSLICCKGFSPQDQMDRYLRWYQEGYLSSTGVSFDLGTTTKLALDSYALSRNPWSGSPDPRRAGNGSLMRLAPIPLAFAYNPKLAVFYAGESSKTTHGARTSIDACRYFGALIVGALKGLSKEEILQPIFEPIPSLWQQNPLSSEVLQVAQGSYKTLNPPEIQGSGYVVKALEAALWAFYHSTEFREGALMAVNLGDDADTTGAIFSQLAGAYYGLEAIPSEWVDQIKMKDKILSMAEELYKLNL